MTTTKEKAEEKLKQLKEAVQLLDDIGWRLSWALDFSKFESINEILNPLTYQVSEAQDEMEALLEQIEEKLNEYDINKTHVEIAFEKECDLQYYTD